MNKYIKLTAVAAVAALVMLEPADAADAADAGKGAKDIFIALVTGNTGLFISLALAVWGLWRWLTTQKPFSLVIVIGGVILTAVPSLFDSVSGWVKAATDFETKTTGAGSSSSTGSSSIGPGIGKGSGAPNGIGGR